MSSAVSSRSSQSEPADESTSFRDKILPKRHVGRWILTVVLLVLIVLVVLAFANAKIDWPAVVAYILDPAFVAATGNVLFLAVISLCAAIVIGLLVTLMRTSGSPVAAGFAWFYVWVFRGVPLLLQIIIWYNLALVVPTITIGIPFTSVVFFSASTNTVMTPLLAAFLGLTLNESAYTSELIRGSLKSVDIGQTEAATALGMAPARIMRRIVLPQAMRTLIPPMGNQFINMLKTTSIASFVTYPELVYVAQTSSAVNLEVIESLFAAAVWYMVLITAFSIGQYFLERKFDAGSSRDTPTSFGRTWARAVTPWLRRPAVTGGSKSIVEENNND